MRDSKLIELFRVLKPNELKQLNRFLNAPYLNEHEDVIRLFEYIRTHINKADEKWLTKENTFKGVFGRTKYDDRKLRYVMSYLLKAIERFLVQNSIEEDKVESQLRLATIYADRNLEKHFNGSIRSLETQQKKVEERGGAFYYQQYRIEKLKGSFLTRQQNRKVDPNLQRTIDNLDLHYIISKLEESCAVLNYQNLVRVEEKHEMRLLEEVLTCIETYELNNIPAIDLYCFILRSLRDSENPEHFEELKRLLKEHPKALPRQEMKSLHTFARNYCIKKINRGHMEYLESIFELYDLSLLGGLLSEEGFMSPWTYKNIVTVGVKLKRFDWVKNFIEEYKNMLPESYMESVHLFACAKLAFEQRDFDQVITLLHQTELSDLLLNLNAKAMLVITYYELDEFNVLSSLLESFRVFLLRKKGLGYHKDTYLNFVRFTKRLVMIDPFNQPKIKKLKEKIAETRTLAEKKWLLEKAQELIK